MAGNKALGKAKDAKQDEFYTQLSDIENELRHYRPHFKGKTVLCNCDDPYESNFFKYFALNFNKLKLKKLIATCYSGSPITGTQLTLFGGEDEEGRRTPYKAIVTTVHDTSGEGGIDMLDIAELFRTGENNIERLDGDGDFRSTECLELLDEADIVVTNPPFSLIREYITTLMAHSKSFIIVAPQSAAKYKETFPLIQQNRMWLGYNAGDMAFCVPEDYEPRETRYWQDEDGQKWRSLGNICWLTNLDIKKRHEETILFRRYNPKDYPSYTNFNGIDVAKASDIPCDYPECMGVPITFMNQHNPEQFEIVGLGEGDLAKEIGITRNHEGRTKLEYQTEDGTYKRPYARVVIKNLHPEEPKQ